MFNFSPGYRNRGAAFVDVRVVVHPAKTPPAASREPFINDRRFIANLSSFKTGFNLKSTFKFDVIIN